MSTFTILKRDGHTTSPPNPHPLKKKKKTNIRTVFLLGNCCKLLLPITKKIVLKAQEK